MANSGDELIKIITYFQELENELKNEADQVSNPIIENALLWLEKTQNKDGGFGLRAGDPSIVQITAFALLALSKAGRQIDSVIIKNLLQYIKGTQNQNGSWPCESGNQLESVGVCGMLVQAFEILGLDKGDPMYNRALHFLRNSFSKEKGCWRENAYSEFGEISVNEAASSAIKDLLLQEDREKLKDFFLKGINVDDGYGWRIGDSRSDTENTAFALKVMANMGVMKDDPIAQKTINYLLNSQIVLGRKKKSGFPLKRNSPPEIDPTAITISSLISIGIEPYDESIRTGVQFLLNSRNEDGGWGDKPGTPSDTDSTALAIIALVDAGMGAVPLVNVKYHLSETQNYVSNFIGSYVQTKDQEIGSLKLDLKGSDRLNRVLEVVITFLAIVLSILVTFIVI
ncbi:MAG TPA: prenyltransferase/squalene oxidase repeat-containing protein [Candidatus Deferrimicrobium sp.]|nr:prenyltransferase/squalene oxidase repeat-containing protein [Candidatus Deferrimicrobium sp.]